MRGFVVELSDGQVIREEDYSWPTLKEYLEKNKHLRIARMHLRFDNRQVSLPNYAKVYFYSKKIRAFIGYDRPQKLLYGVGASSNDEMTITWYDGSHKEEEIRRVDKDKPAFIIAP